MKSVSDALQLMAWFGTIGSRSRNGWGSLSLEAKSDTKGLSSRPGAENELLRRIGREWTKCLELDWPHALGFSCGKPLMWISQPYPDWRKVMGCLANIRVEVRAVAKAYAGPERIGGIHLLGYPAGNHWELRQLKKGKPQRDDQEGRLATQLRFKVLRTSEGLTGMVFHMPHRFPDELMDRLTVEQKEWLRNNEQEAWTEIHKALDGSSRLTPLGETI
jgi:CRISPR-associated protein Cmr1